MLNDKRVRQMVRRGVYRTLGISQEASPSASRPLVTEADVQAIPPGGELPVPPGALVTPLARQVAMDRRITLASSPSQLSPAKVKVWESGSSQGSGQLVAIGADHGGYNLKQ